MQIDEPWLAEQSWFLARDGYVHSNFFTGIDGAERYIVLYHRLFIQAQSVAFRFLGLGVLQARLVSIVAGMVLLGLVVVYARRGLGFSTNMTVAAVATLLLNPVFFLSFKIARPEMLVALFGFASVAATGQATHSARSVLWAVAGGLLAACAMLAHLFGAIFVGAGCLVLLARRRFPESAAFAAAAVLALVPYTLDAAHHWGLFEAQLHGSTARAVTTFSPVSPLLNLLNEHKRIFRTPQIIFPSALFFLSLGLGWRLASPRVRFLAGYTLLLMVALGAIAVPKQARYATCLAPLETLVVVGIMSRLGGLDRWRRQALLAVAVMFAASGAWSDGRDLGGKTRLEPLHRIVAGTIPDGAWCLTPMPLLFNEVARLNLVSTVALRSSVGTEPGGGAVRSFVASRRIQYVVAMHGEPSDTQLQAMEPLELTSEGMTDGTAYRVFKVVYPDAVR